MTKATEMDEKAREAAEFEGTLPALRAYRKSDPAFERALAEYVHSKAMLQDDPAEGRQQRDGSPIKQGPGSLSESIVS